MNVAAGEHLVYAFRYRDPRTKKWHLARYMASKVEIAAAYAEWEIVGAGEMRRPIGDSYFTPHAVELVAPRRALSGSASSS